MFFEPRKRAANMTMDDLKFAWRRILQRPAASLASVVTLACSIAAAAATWSLLSAVLIDPLPISFPDRVFVVGRTRDVAGMPPVSESHVYPVLQQVRDSGAFPHVVAGGEGAGRLLVETNGRPVRTDVYFCTYDWFDLLGVRIALGRGFTEGDDRRGATPVAILSDAYWRRTFDADARVLGRVLTIGGVKATVVGIAPPGFRGLSLAGAPEIYLPFHTVGDISSPSMNFFADGTRTASPTAWVTILGRVTADAGAPQAAERLAVLDRPGIAGRAPLGHVLVPVTTAALPAAARVRIEQFSQLLGLTVGLLLLIGCTTVGMLLLVRTEGRREELAMCLALGASRARLASGIVLEGMMVSVSGALFALPLAFWLFALVRTFQLPGNVSVELLALSLDARVVAASAAGALVASALIGLVAGGFGFSADVADALRSRSGATPRRTRRRTRTFLVAGEVAVALVLLTGAGLFARSLSAALNLNPGFDTDRLVTGNVSLGSHGYTPVTAAGFASELVSRLQGNPALRSFALTESLGGMTPSGRLVIDGEPRQFPSMVSHTSVDERYFATMGLRLIAGRNFAATDTASSPPVIIVSESFGRMIASGGDPLGRRIRATSSRPPAPPAMQEIVGVVPDVISNVAIAEPLVMYIPKAQSGGTTDVRWVARAAGSSSDAIREILGALKQIDSSVTPSPMLTMREQFGRQMSAQLFGGTVLGVLGLVAVLLTALGTYVLSEAMAQVRLREMGIRAALGASGRQLATLVLMETLRLAGIGVIAGLFVSWAGAGSIRAFLFKVQPLDPITLSAVAAAILLLALAASVKPALRAARVDVAALLRQG
jgi:putative ABC transport system permease protein